MDETQAYCINKDQLHTSPMQFSHCVNQRVLLQTYAGTVYYWHKLTQEKVIQRLHTHAHTPKENCCAEP